MPWPWKRGYGSVKDIGNATIRQSAHDFLLTFYSNYGSISCRSWDIQCRIMSWPWNPGQRSLKAIQHDNIRSGTHDFLLTLHSNHFPTPCVLRPRWRGSPWNWVSALGSEKNRKDGANRWLKKFQDWFSRLDTILAYDIQPSSHVATAIAALCIKCVARLKIGFSC